MKILGSLFKRLFRRTKAYTDAISAAIDADDQEAKKENIYALLAFLGVRLAVWVIGLIITATLHLNALYLKASAIIGIFGVVAALDPGGDQPDVEEIEQAISPFDIAIEEGEAEAEAETLHDSLCNLIYNAIAEAAESTSLKRPLSGSSIETGREKPYRMDETLAIHQFAADVTEATDQKGRDDIWDKLQRHMNSYSLRYPYLKKDGRPPVIFDVKDGGDHLIIEVVLYSEKNKEKIRKNFRKHIARQKKIGDIYDKDT